MLHYCSLDGILTVKAGYLSETLEILGAHNLLSSNQKHSRSVASSVQPYITRLFC